MGCIQQKFTAAFEELFLQKILITAMTKNCTSKLHSNESIQVAKFIDLVLGLYPFPILTRY